MNIETGELRRVEGGAVLPPGWVPVPGSLEAWVAEALERAEREGKPARVAMDGDNPLSQWRRDEARKKAKQKARARRKGKLARKARRRG